MTAIVAFTTPPTSQVPNAAGGSTGLTAGVATGFEALLALTGLPATGEAPTPDAAVMGAETLKSTLDPIPGQAEAAAQAAAGLVAAMSQPAIQSFMAPLVAEDAGSPPVSAAAAPAAIFTPPVLAQAADRAPVVDREFQQGAQTVALATPAPVDIAFAAPGAATADALTLAVMPVQGQAAAQSQTLAQSQAPAPAKTMPHAPVAAEAVA